MSEDNYIFIDKNKNPIEIWRCIASQVSDDINDQKNILLGIADNLNTAFSIAYNEPTEYGIYDELWCK
jgi:hypothetical protein